MQSYRTSFRIHSISLIILTIAGMAHAQTTRTWVSGVGDDVNPCSRTAPCKTFAGAISKTATNGEINCLDPAGYGAVTVTKSITIDCHETQGSILSAGTNGVIVNITSATDTKKAFRIRGVSINGVSTGINGIRILAANQVIVEDCVIDGVTQHGISFETTTGTTRAVVENTNIRSAVGNGINTFIAGGNLNLAVSNCRISNSATGLNLSSSTKATITNSVIVENTTGLAAFNADMGVAYCNISHNGTGVSAIAGGNIRITNNMITSNGTGLSVAGGTLVSFGTNMLHGNTTQGAPTSTVSLQ